MAGKKKSLPTNLIEAIEYFSDLDVATEFVANLRWPDGPICPDCGGKDHSYLSTRRLWKCKNKTCHRQFSVKVGTIFEDSPIPLNKWLAAIWEIANDKNGISSHELGRKIGVTQKTAWFMTHRIRLAMKTGTFTKFSGEVESDEGFVGGKATNMHRSRRRERFGTGDEWKGPHANKTIVMGILQRGGEIQTHVVPSLHRSVVQAKIRDAVLPGASVYTDKMGGYSGIDAFSEYEHRVVDHAEKYVDGRVHVNGVENFWSLLKRSLKGTYVSVYPEHLHRYLDEQVYRFNRRDLSDPERVNRILGKIEGKRVTWKGLTGTL